MTDSANTAPAPAPNLASPRAVAELLARIGAAPKKALGQNFLIDGNTLAHIADAAQLSPASKILEVGPGLGALTERLLPRCASLLAIEKDPILAAYLRARFAAEPRLQIREADALDCGLPAIFATGQADSMVSNLPYSVGTRVVVEATLGAVPPASMTLLLQKEVADRFAAAPKTSDYGALSIWLQSLYEVRTVRKVPPTCFHPPPEVVSAVVTLRLRAGAGQDWARDHALRRHLHALSKTAFLNRRKQLASSMRSASGGLARDADFIRRALAAANAPPSARPEELDVPQWIALAQLWR
jgi:dimethyladenosine transferase